MKLRLGLMALAAIAFVAMGAGCANTKQQAERDSLLNQNKDQAAQIQDLQNQIKAEQEATAAARAQASVAAAPSGETSPPAMGGDETGGVLDMTGTPTGGAAGRSGRTTRTGTASIAGVGSSTNGAGEVVLELPGDALFDSGKATIKASAKKTLDSVAATIKKQYGGRLLRIEGHTDPSPVKSSGWDDNYDLGFVRARAVQKYLASKGIPEKDMYPASFGAEHLKSTKNYALDRRVDIVVVENEK